MWMVITYVNNIQIECTKKSFKHLFLESIFCHFTIQPDHAAPDGLTLAIYADKEKGIVTGIAIAFQDWYAIMIGGLAKMTVQQVKKSSVIVVRNKSCKNNAHHP